MTTFLFLFIIFCDIYIFPLTFLLFCISLCFCMLLLMVTVGVCMLRTSNDNNSVTSNHESAVLCDVRPLSQREEEDYVLFRREIVTVPQPEHLGSLEQNQSKPAAIFI